MQRIVSFSGEFRFLSNFWLCEVEFEGLNFHSTEHAYQAAKTLDLEIRKTISENKSPGQAKRLGQKLEIRSDWEDVKVSVMRNLLEQKFKQGSELRDLLNKTKGFELIEGNTWGDTFWGQCPIGTGKNTLGKLLMEIRDDSLMNFIEN